MPAQLELQMTPPAGHFFSPVAANTPSTRKAAAPASVYQEDPTIAEFRVMVRRAAAVY